MEPNKPALSPSKTLDYSIVHSFKEEKIPFQLTKRKAEASGSPPPRKPEIDGFLNDARYKVRYSEHRYSVLRL